MCWTKACSASMGKREPRSIRSQGAVVDPLRAAPRSPRHDQPQQPLEGMAECHRFAPPPARSSPPRGPGTHRCWQRRMPTLQGWPRPLPPGRCLSEKVGSRPRDSQIGTDLAHQKLLNFSVPGDGTAPVELGLVPPRVVAAFAQEGASVLAEMALNRQQHGLRRGSSPGLPAAPPSAKPPALHAFVPGHSRLAPLPPSRSTSPRHASRQRCSGSQLRPQQAQHLTNHLTKTRTSLKQIVHKFLSDEGVRA